VSATRIWHGALAVIAGFALVLQTVLSLSHGPEPLLTRAIRLASYFTIQANLLVLITAIGIARNPDRDGPVWRVLRINAVLGITITGIVFGLLLASTSDPQGWDWVANAGLHYFAPPLTLAGWLLFGPRPRLDRRTLAWSWLWPVLWIGYTVAHGVSTDWYPYPFLDATELGLPTALLNMFFVLVTAGVLSVLMLLVDRRPEVRLSRRTSPDRSA
jgi:hypothetical protein